MARHCRATAASEEPETVVEPGCEALYSKGCGARRRKLDRQRDAVEAPTNSADRGRNPRVRRKVWGGCARPLDEQPNRAVAKQVLAIRVTFCRHGERRYGVDPLALGS